MPKEQQPARHTEPKPLSSPENAKAAEEYASEWFLRFLSDQDRIDEIKRLQVLVFENDLDQFVQRALKETIAWESLCELAANFLRKGLPLPQPLAKFTAFVLTNPESKPKTKKGRKVGGNNHRNTLICSIIYLLARQGYLPVSCDDTKRALTSPPRSICDVVARAYSRIAQASLDGGSVRKIWQNYSKENRDALPWAIRLANETPENQIKILTGIIKDTIQPTENPDDFIPESLLPGNKGGI